MERSKTIEEFIEVNKNWSKELNFLRKVILKTELEETIKWGIPTYTIMNKNVVGIGAFKSYVGLWFFNGSFLKNIDKKLINAQEGKTKGMRQWKFQSIDEMDEVIILKYLEEAIENQKAGKEIKIERNKEVVLPNELLLLFEKNKDLKLCFEKFSNSKQREFAEYIMSAKKEITKQVRIQKIIPMIMTGVGLHDKYRNC